MRENSNNNNVVVPKIGIKQKDPRDKVRKIRSTVIDADRVNSFALPSSAMIADGDAVFKPMPQTLLNAVLCFGSYTQEYVKNGTYTYI